MARDEPAPAELRNTLGRFATGVTIVTSTYRDEAVGFTCQSFSSVSLNPPMVLFCPSRTSGTWTKIRGAGVFTINVLAEDQRRLCERFAAKIPDRFSGQDWEMTPWGPSLPEALATIHCELLQAHEAGDHYIAMGLVRHLAVLRDAPPLLFFRSNVSRLHPSDLQPDRPSRVTTQPPLSHALVVPV